MSETPDPYGIPACEEDVSVADVKYMIEVTESSIDDLQEKISYQMKLKNCAY